MNRKWLIVGGAVIFVAILGVVTTVKMKSSTTAVIWTDRAEFVRYAEIFNASQSDFRAEVQYRPSPAQALLEGGQQPDIVIGESLKNAALRAWFQPAEYLFSTLRIVPTAFYPSLLELGNIGGKQLLLPVSFNLPLAIYQRGTAGIKSSFVITLDEMRELGKPWNRKQGNQYVRMGFSPRWSRDFLFDVAELYGAGFREEKPLGWDQGNLDKAVQYVRDWTKEANETPEAEDDFQFKYLYNPDYKSVADGRILFGYTDSSEFFVLPDDKRATLDYRWISRNDQIPVRENALYLAICKKGHGRQAADAFVQWFYNEENQRQMLEESKQLRVNDTFGIAGGFSALKGVNDRVFPAFYPILVGHFPPQDYIRAPHRLPNGWQQIKENVVQPWLADAVSLPPDPSGKLAIDPLSKRLDVWIKQNMMQ